MPVVSSLFLAAWVAIGVRGLSPQQLASSFDLTSATVFDFPSSPMGNGTASNFILNSTAWSIKKFTENAQDVSFVADPFPNSSPSQQNPNASPSNSSATVLAVNYPAGSFSHGTGGTQFDNFFTSSGSSFQSMMVTYEIAFESGFDFVKGGKLPGLRGGPNNSGCSGGLQPNGTDCFSTRIMWRTNGAGEAYIYVPTPNNFCSQKNLICNSDSFGDSVSRGSFTFTPAQWARITMLVQLNDPGEANGQLWVYFNDNQVIKQQNMYYRASDAIQSVQGMYFSTFFGGNDASWSTPTSQNTYFRNIQLWAGPNASNATGAAVKSSAPATAAGRMSVAWSIVGAGILAGLSMMV